MELVLKKKQITEAKSYRSESCGKVLSSNFISPIPSVFLSLSPLGLFFFPSLLNELVRSSSFFFSHRPKSFRKHKFFYRVLFQRNL